MSRRALEIEKEGVLQMDSGTKVSIAYWEVKRDLV
jgi:hypothetical protein